MNSTNLTCWLLVPVIGVFWVLLAASAKAQAPFYQGKTVTVVYGGSGPGGTGDLRVRAVTSVLKKHIPGNPTILIDYRTGGGGRVSANHVYAKAQPDGLTIGAMSSNVIPAYILGESGVLYDLDKFIYLGTPYSGHAHVFLTRKQAGLDNLEKVLAATGLRVGAQSVGHTIYYTGRMFAYLMGLKEPKFVVGYTGQELEVAMRNGEVDARTNHSESPLRQKWIEQGIADVHGIIEVPKGNKHPDPRYAHLRDLETFARTEREHKLVALHRAFQAGGGPYVLPPGVPKDRVQILQEAMRKTLADPEFHAEYKKTGDESNPLTAEMLEKVIKEMPRDRDAIELFKRLFGADPLPGR